MFKSLLGLCFFLIFAIQNGETSIMETLFKKHRVLISQVDTSIVRQQMNIIDWEKQLVAIRGSRGVGKTTLMRQYIKLNYGVNAGEALYCVMDSMYFTNHSLFDMAEQFHLMGGKHLFLDEVHKYPTWSKEIKEIIDLWPDLKITFTGSSLLQILNSQADLSRRVLSYHMPGLSFREYVHFYKGAARQLAAQKLSASGQALEDVLRGRKAGDIAALSKAFLADYDEAFEAIEGSLAVL